MNYYTYAYNDKVQTSPGFRKVSPEPKRDPLEYHLYEKQHRKDHINYLEYEHEFFIVLKIDVLKTQGETGCKDKVIIIQVGSIRKSELPR